MGTDQDGVSGTAGGLREPNRALNDPTGLFPQSPGCARYGLLVGMAAYILLVTAVAQVTTWVIDSVRMDSSNGLPGWVWVLATWGQVVAMEVLLLPPARRMRWPQLRPLYRTWAIAAGLAALLAVGRLPGIGETQLAIALQLGLAVIAVVGLVVARGRGTAHAALIGQETAHAETQRRKELKGDPGLAGPVLRETVGEHRPATRDAGGRWVGVGAVLAAAAMAGVVILPSVIWGALGSPLDAVLALGAGLALGAAAGLLLEGWLFEPLSAAPGGHGRALATFGAGTALFILASGFGIRGSQLLMLIVLPGLAIPIVALVKGWLQNADPRGKDERGLKQGSVFAEAGTEPWSQRPDRAQRRAAWLAVTVLVGIVAAGLGMFWDPLELSLVLGPEDILGWALRAAELGLLLAVVVGVVAWVVLGTRRSRGAPVEELRRSRDADDAEQRGRTQADEEEPVGSGGMEGGAADSSSTATREPEGGMGRQRVSGVVVGLVAALAVWVLVAGAYVRLGHPGFYGEELFVILREQADLKPAYQIADRGERLRYVYETSVQNAERTQARLRQVLASRGIEYKAYYLVNGLQVTGGPSLRNYLAAQPEVDRIVNSARLRPLPALPPAPQGSSPKPDGLGWNVKLIGADRVWNELGVKGKGIVIGQSDSGVQGDHPALSNGYRGRQGGDDYNWIDPWFDTKSPVDVGGHGTHTLGSALGRNGIGVAPEAEWMACVNLARNLGNPGWYLNCMQFMLAPYRQGGDPFRDGDPGKAAHVLNNSWGCPPIEGCDANTLAAAAEALRAAGIYVVASAGNGGPGCATIADPIALYGDVLSVGAIDRNSQLADFSSRGPVTADGSDRTKPDVVAPGVSVLSAYPGSTYAVESGTSMAGPHVAGVVALMWSAQPRLVGDIERTTQILRQTAKPYAGRLDSCAGSGVPNNDVGYGLVDAYAAVKAALEIK